VHYPRFAFPLKDPLTDYRHYRRFETPAIPSGLRTPIIPNGLRTPAISGGLRTSAIPSGLRTLAIFDSLKTPLFLAV